jgi:hypothetical protein
MIGMTIFTLPIFSYCCIPLQHPLVCVCQFKVHVASEGHHVVVSTNTSKNRMAG